MTSYLRTILADAPRAYYRLDETAGTVAYDAINGYNGTLTGVSAYGQPGALTGDADTSLAFTGAGGIRVPSTLNYTTWAALSLEFWSNASGAWQHIVATCDGTHTIVYVNAVVTTPSFPAPIDISQIFAWAGSATACNLDEVAIYNYVLSPAQIQNHYTVGTSAAMVPGTPGGVYLLINDVWYPTIRQETVSIDRTTSDPIPTFKVTIQDDPSSIPLSELQEIIFIDAGHIAYPAHNLLVNATNFGGSAWTGSGALASLITTSGAQMSMSFNNNAQGVGLLAQRIIKGAIMPGQSYCLSGTVQGGGSNINYYAEVDYFDATGTIIGATATAYPPIPGSTQFTLTGTAPAGTVYVTVNLGGQTTASTNSGSLTISNVQFEPMTFAGGHFQMSYPSPWCAVGQPNCVVLPDGSAIRQYRLFGGYITKATAGRYIGNNRQWTLTVSGYAWLLQKQLLNDNFTNQTDKAIITSLVNKYFANQFSVAQVAQGATLDVFGYTFNGTARDAVDALAANSNFYFYIDAYRTIYYQPPGYNQLGFMLSDQPDGVSSFPYYNYTLDIDGTQLANACLVTGGTNISAVEYDGQSIGYYNQKTGGQGIFWRTVNDSTIGSTNAARMRAIAEISQYNYARQVVHLSTQQMMIPGYTVLFSSRTDDLYEVPFLIQKSTLILQGFTSLQTPQYECSCDIGAFNPDLVNITVKLLRKQLTNANNIGTPVIGLMATEETTFVDSIAVSVIRSGPSGTYGMGTYGTTAYASSVPNIPPTQYGAGTYGDTTKGYL